jgi:hypothetical protein
MLRAKPEAGDQDRVLAARQFTRSIIQAAV